MKFAAGITIIGLLLVLSPSSRAERFIDNSELKGFCDFLFPQTGDQRTSNFNGLSAYLNALDKRNTNPETQSEIAKARPFAKRSSEYNSLLNNCYRQCTIPTNPSPEEAEAFEKERIAAGHSPGTDPLKNLKSAASCFAKGGKINSVLEDYFLDKAKTDKAFEFFGIDSWVITPKNPPPAIEKGPAPGDTEARNHPFGRQPLIPILSSAMKLWMTLPRNGNVETTLIERPRAH